MAVTVRPIRAGEERLYLEIVGRAIRGLAAPHYPAEAIEGWVPPLTDDYVEDIARNADNEIRLIAELDGTPVGIGALVAAGSELRACYVAPDAARRGCGTAIVGEIERLAREQGLRRLELAASLNAEAFYASNGYRVRERSSVTLPHGTTLACVWMEKEL